MPYPALRSLALDRSLGPRAIRVYGFLSHDLDFVRYRQVKLLPVAKALGLRRDGVARALKLLVASGYLERNGRAWPGGPFTYRLTYSRDEVPPPTTPQVA